MNSLKHLVSAILFASLLFGCSGGDSSSGLDKSRTEITEDSEALTVAEPSTEIVDEDEELFVDESDLVEQTASSFKVTTPNGGQKWTTGKSYAIKWTKCTGTAPPGTRSTVLSILLTNAALGRIRKCGVNQRSGKFMRRTKHILNRNITI